MDQAFFLAFFLCYLFELSDNPVDEHYDGPNLSDEETAIKSLNNFPKVTQEAKSAAGIQIQPTWLCSPYSQSLGWPCLSYVTSFLHTMPHKKLTLFLKQLARTKFSLIVLLGLIINTVTWINKLTYTRQIKPTISAWSLVVWTGTYKNRYNYRNNTMSGIKQANNNTGLSWLGLIISVCKV